MELKKKSLRLEQFLWVAFTAFLILLLCGIPVANAQTPQQIAKEALAATVLLVMEDADGKLLGLGSGFFVQSNQIATNFHIIEGAVQGTAKRVGQETEYTIEGFTATDENHDLAILQVSSSDVQPLPLGDSDTVEIGDTVYVAGNPKGYLEGTFSDGIISGVRGSVGEKRLQMTAPISPGSSGGPVLNGTGKVIGISVMTVEGGQNLNFAIPSNYLKELVTTVGTAIPLLKGKQSISAETYLRWGIRKYEFGLYQSAIADYDKAIQLKPDYAEAYFNRGNAKYYLEQYTAAITDFDTYIRLKPDDALVYVGRGMAKSRLNQYVAAIADFDAAIRLKPDYAFAYICRGNANHDLDQHFAAITDFDAAIRLDPDDALAYRNRGNAKEELGQHFAAIADYNTAIQLDPDYALAYRNRGGAKYQLGQYFAAIADFDTTIRLKPDDALVYVGRGMAKSRLNQYIAAIADFDAAIRLKPDYAFAYICRGNANHDLGQHFAAITDFDAAIRLDPDDAFAYVCRGVSKYKRSRTWEAKQDFQMAWKLAEQAGDEGLKAHIEATVNGLY